MRWFIDNTGEISDVNEFSQYKNGTFFIKYSQTVKDIQRKFDRKRTEKRLHYRDNLQQVIKNLVVSDNLFIEKIFEESSINGGSPKASGSLLKSSGFSNLRYSKDNEEEKIEDLVYPLRDIEDFIILLKATNVSKIQDYIILYTLLDMHYDKNEYEFESLLQSLDLHQTFKEIKLYWRLDTEFIRDSSHEELFTDINNIDTSKLQWHSSILQSLLELKCFDIFNIFMN